MRTALLVVLFALTACSSVQSQPAVGALPAKTEISAGEPVTVARAKQFDLVSRLNGKKYRVFVSTPFEMDPATRYPVLYVLDGSGNFNTASQFTTRQSGRIAGPGIIVGIGYPTDNPKDIAELRLHDLTISRYTGTPPIAPTGGADMFLNVIEQEIMPFVEATYQIDPAKRAIWGQSVGGLTVLRTMFRKPGLFSTYILSSPSIWWNEREILADEKAFVERVKAKNLRLNILITSAGDEQYRGADAARLADAQQSRMIDNASELAARLTAHALEGLHIQRTIFDGESHLSVSGVSLNRSIPLAFPLKK